MDTIFTGLAEAFKMLIQRDTEVYLVTLLTLQVSGAATVLSVITGIPLGIYLALRRFPGKSFLISLINTGMGLPPTVVGLWVSIFLWRYGPFGYLNIMYTPVAMLIAQFVIACPVVTAFTIAAIQNLNPKLHLQIQALGASRFQYYLLLIKEAKYALAAAVIAGFGSVISEVGASMMVGGNIKGYTRVLTTATVMEVSKGNLEVALALGAILLVLAYSITLMLTIMQQREGN
jgi:tungstate transport system permease protein